MSKPLEALRNTFRAPELQRRVIFALIVVALYQMASHVPTPGTDRVALAEKLRNVDGVACFYDILHGEEK